MVHRGWKENDVLLGTFLEATPINTWTEAEVKDVDWLMGQSDYVVYDALTAENPGQVPMTSGILEKLRQHAR